MKLQYSLCTFSEEPTTCPWIHFTPLYPVPEICNNYNPMCPKSPTWSLPVNVGDFGFHISTIRPTRHFHFIILCFVALIFLRKSTTYEVGLQLSLALCYFLRIIQIWCERNITYIEFTMRWRKEYPISSNFATTIVAETVEIFVGFCLKTGNWLRSFRVILQCNAL